MRVDATDPPETVLGTRLNVRVLGSGFDNGSQATFRLGDDGPTLITHSTTFVSDKELVADVEVLADDEVGLRDVEVLTARGRKGIGIELFDVKNTGPPPPSAAVPLQVTFREAPDDGVLSDGQGVYIHEVDKVSAHLRENNGHFRLFTAFNLKGKEEATRKLCFDFGSGGGGIPESFTDGSGCDSASAGELMAKGMVTSNALDADGAPFPGGMLGMTPGNQITMRSSTYFEADGFGWTLRYGRDCDLNDVPFNDPTRVTFTGGADSGTDGFSDAWTIEASGPSILCKTNLKGKAVTTEVGSFTMPFQLTAVRLP